MKSASTEASGVHAKRAALAFPIEDQCTLHTTSLHSNADCFDQHPELKKQKSNNNNKNNNKRREPFLIEPAKAQVKNSKKKVPLFLDQYTLHTGSSHTNQDCREQKKRASGIASGIVVNTTISNSNRARKRKRINKVGPPIIVTKVAKENSTSATMRKTKNVDAMVIDNEQSDNNAPLFNFDFP